MTNIFKSQIIKESYSLIHEVLDYALKIQNKRFGYNSEHKYQTYYVELDY